MAVLVHRRVINAKPKVVLAATLLAALSIFSLRRYFNHDRVTGVEVIPITTGAVGPESLAFDPDGEGPYTGVSDGRILKWQDNQWLEYAVDSPPSLADECRGTRDIEREHICGRPLGLQFHKKTRNLYIADASFGLMVVGPGDKFVEPVATGADGHPFMCTNGLEIDQENGIVYFTDSSLRFRRRDLEAAMDVGDNTGRLMKYDPRTKAVQVMLRGLHLANGVQLSVDGSFLLVAETGSNRILRYWLCSPKNGTVEVLAQLPGAPDNVKRSPRGGFWVAMHVTEPERLQNVVIRLPFGNEWSTSRGGALAMRIGEEGETLEAMDGFGSEMGSFISEVEERNGTLWIGSVMVPYVGLYRL